MNTDTFGIFGNVICCDDIRQEMNSKFIFVGVYANDIVVSAFPAQLFLRLFVQYQAPEVGDQKLDFVWQLDDAELVVMEGGVHQSDVSYLVNIPLPAAPLNIDKEGTLKVSARLESGLSKEIYQTLVRKSEAPIPFV